MIGLIPRGGGIIWFVGVGLAGGPATFADTQDPPCADEYDPGKVWQVWLAGVVGWVRLAGRPGWPMGETHPYCIDTRSIARSTPRGFGGGVA